MLLFAAALFTAIAFSVRFVVVARYWSDHTPPEIAGWMTPAYVARTANVPVSVLVPSLGPGQTLQDIARARGIDLDVLATEITATLQAYRESQE